MFLLKMFGLLLQDIAKSNVGCRSISVSYATAHGLLSLGLFHISTKDVTKASWPTRRVVRNELQRTLPNCKSYVAQDTMVASQLGIIQHSEAHGDAQK